MSAQAYPLAWPVSVPRTKRTQTAKFGDHSVAACVDTIKAEVHRLGGNRLVISTNIPLRVDGNPYSNPGRLPDPGAAVYFQLNGKPYCMPCDKWATVEDNLWAVTKNIEAMRGMQRWGVGSVAQQFAGFAQLTSGDAWRDVLKVPPAASLADVELAYRTAAQRAHPDRGGSEDEMRRLNVARDEARKELA